MHAVRVFAVVVAVLAGLLIPAATAEAAPLTTVPVHGLEYGATLTEGRFAGTARGEMPGLWAATVVHDPLEGDAPVAITDGTFTLRGRDGAVSGVFDDGSVTPSDLPDSCDDERFDVEGTLALDDGGHGSFRAVLTHLRRQTDSGCRVYGATVVGSLRVPARAVTG